MQRRAPHGVHDRASLPRSELLEGARLPDDHPLLDLAALPAALLLAVLVTSAPFGRMLAVLCQIQFHELGHALAAWLSSRAALPLPFGFTFVSEHASVFTGVCMLFLIGVWCVRAFVERRGAALSLGVLLLCVFVCLTFFGTPEGATKRVLLAGFVGELCLPAAALLAFYVRFPDRMRWDFFRFVVLAPAALALTHAVRSWLVIIHGQRSLPLSSFLPGDGNGDFERLIREHAMSEPQIVAISARCVWLTTLSVSCLYAWFAVRAVLALRAQPR